MSNNQITGVMQLNEPVQIVHNVTGLNILLRGSVNTSKHELVCLVMETGIDSLTLKQLQYPRQLTPATNEG